MEYVLDQLQPNAVQTPKRGQGGVGLVVTVHLHAEMTAALLLLVYRIPLNVCMLTETYRPNVTECNPYKYNQ